MTVSPQGVKKSALGYFKMFPFLLSREVQASFSLDTYSENLVELLEDSTKMNKCFTLLKLLAIFVLCILELCSGLVNLLEIIPVDSCFKM